MKNQSIPSIVVTTCLSISMLLSSSADEPAPVSKPSDEKELIVFPRGLAPLNGTARILPNDANSAAHDWSLRLTVPKVTWEKVDNEFFSNQYFHVKADVEMISVDMQMGYHRATALAERAQNRLIDLNGKRLTREEAQKCLASNSSVLVSLSGELPEKYYLSCVKPDTLVVLIGLLSEEDIRMLPTSKSVHP